MTELEEVQKQVGEFFDKLDFGVTVETTQEEELYMVKLTTKEDPAMLIGRHAQTLASFQRLISVILYRHFGKKIDVLVDINDYRAGQRERLEGIAGNVGTRVMDEGRAATMKAFSPYERRIIHEYVSAHFPELTSYSEGEGEDRTLVIEKKTKE